MIYVKDHFPPEIYELAYLTLWDYCFVKHIDISVATNMAQALGEHFTKSQVVDIMTAASTPQYKAALTETTRKLYEEYGAFGAPWLWIRNDETSKSEPFFGSDRWAYIWDFLGVPYQNVEILPRDKISQAKL
jgi:glutathione S-transferase kappa 1